MSVPLVITYQGFIQDFSLGGGGGGGVELACIQVCLLGGQGACSTNYSGGNSGEF